MALSIAGKTQDQNALLPTVVVAIAMSTVVMGLTLFALGWFRLGIIVRFFPPVVVSGFLAGTGMILLLGGLGFLMNSNLDIQHLNLLFASGSLER